MTSKKIHALRKNGCYVWRARHVLAPTFHKVPVCVCVPVCTLAASSQHMK